MSLIVLAFYVDPQTNEKGEDVWPEEPGAELAGFEVYRHELWSHESLVRRGASFLPQLKSSDLYIWPWEVEALDAFERECQMLLAETEAILEEIDLPVIDARGFRFRVNNFLKAIQTAREIGGGVYIG